MTLSLVLADDPPVDPTTGHGPEWGKAAPVALLIIVLMGIALFLLIKSMNRQLRKVPKTFVGEPIDPTVASDGSDDVADSDDSIEAAAMSDADPPGHSGPAASDHQASPESRSTVGPRPE